MRQIVIHGHFYQPPREDPWLELVPRERSAAPDHDWNERITRQCYLPLAEGRLLDPRGRITGTLNAYAWCSLDVGPTLFRWFDDHAPAVRDAIIAADRASIARVGTGNALAMPYHHVIMPLLSRRDKLTEIRWGMQDFRQRFGREPAGMWLPETAVDDETLAALADEGIRFTVLAPEQVTGTPPFGRPGRWRAGGRELAIFAYDGAAAHHVAFGHALDDASQWEAGLLASALAADGGPTVVSLATDGETFGHHHRFGDLALVALIDRLAKRADVQLTNFAAVLRDTPPQHDVGIVSPSSWSCPHGIERWRRECGCRFEPGTSQAWRAPLRSGLDNLAHGISECVERLWPAAAGDFDAARDSGGALLAGAQQLPPDARQLLEAEQNALAMFTSCAWFFDDIGRLEPRIVLRHAARALDLLPDADRERLTAPLVATLAQAQSNDPAKGDGAAIWRRDVMPAALGLAHLAAGVAALRELAPDALEQVSMPAHSWTLDGDDVILQHRRTGRSSRWRAEPVTFGVLAVRAHVRQLADGPPVIVDIADYPQPICNALHEIATPMILDAALTADDMTALRGGLLDRAAARDRALAGAWLLVERDGLELAGIVVHGVLDLYDLEGSELTDHSRMEAYRHLAALPATRPRQALAERMLIALGEGG